MPRIAELRHVGQVQHWPQPGCQRRLQLASSGFGKRVRRDTLAAPFLFLSASTLAGELQSAAAQVAIVDAGALAQFRRQRWEQGSSVCAQCIEGVLCRGRIARRQDTCAGPGCLAAKVPLFDDADAQPFAAQEIRGGQPNHAATDYQYINCTTHTFRYRRVAQLFLVANAPVRAYKAKGPFPHLAAESLMQLTLQSIEGSLARLASAGDISPTTGPGNINAMEEALGMGCYGYKVLLNLEKSNYITSAGVGWLIGCHKNFDKAGGRLILHSIPPRITHVLQMFKLNQFLHLAKDEAAALKTLAGADS